MRRLFMRAMIVEMTNESDWSRYFSKMSADPNSSSGVSWVTVSPSINEIGNGKSFPAACSILEFRVRTRTSVRVSAMMMSETNGAPSVP